MSYGVLAIQGKETAEAAKPTAAAAATAATAAATSAEAAKAKEPYYLLIRRKDSFSYVEFLRGKYKLTNHDYIQLLFNEMTTEERGRLLTGAFSDLWFALWSGQHTRQFRTESETAQSIFEAFRASGDSLGRPLSFYAERCTHHYEEPEWGFPKGRRNIHESDMACATREWREETGLPEDALRILPVPPCEESYTGSNGIPYKQIYYLGVCKTATVSLLQENSVMTREIGGIRWCSIDDAMTLLRKTNPVKRDLLQQIHRRVVHGDLRHLLA